MAAVGPDSNGVETRFRQQRRQQAANSSMSSNVARPRFAESRCKLVIALAVGVAACTMAGHARAGDATGNNGCLGCRPGYPPRVGALSAPSNTWHYGGYYVGGGTLFRGQPRYVNEGTWGWDYSGLLNHKWIVLDWSHGRRYRAGGGPYRTAGPSPLPSQ